jgi:signal transduction histidine kinase
MPAEPQAERVSAFGGDVERFRFGLLESGHAVLFRNAVRNGKRVVQGALLEREALLDRSLVSAYESSPLAGMSDFVIAYGDEILRILGSDNAVRYASAPGSLAGSLLHRARLSPPFENVELVFSVRRLPPGPAAGVLAWTAALIAIVLVAGFVGLYRLGVGQIRLARQQQDFVSAISHELKTPLTSIRMYGEMLREGWPDQERRRQYYEYIHEESERLSRLIENVLQLARISRQEADLELTSVSIAALVDLIESKLVDSVKRAGFELDLSIDPAVEARSLRLDPDSFLQIAINLIDNALKFASSAERRTVDCAFRAGRDETVVFAIRDYGPGVPKTQLKRIFELFYRPRSELTRETVGTGIGLSIVKTLAERMGGRVDALNADPGAEFRVTFPAEPVT